MKRGFQAFFGALLLVLGLVAASSGGFLAVLVGPDGKIAAPAGNVVGEGYALVLNEFSIDTVGDPNTVRGFADFQIGASSTENERIFIGIAPAAEVNSYLARSARDVVSDISNETARVVPIPGADKPDDPMDETFWDAKAEGADPVLSLERSGVNQSLVIMNSSASQGVNVNMTLGLISAALFPIGLGIVVLGVLFLVLGVMLLVRSSRGRTEGVPRSVEALLPPIQPAGNSHLTSSSAPTQALPPTPAASPQGGPSSTSDSPSPR